MKIERLKIMNVLGHDNFELKAGKFNEIKGGNGTGKSSIITSLTSAVSGTDKKEATMLRKGSEQGQVVLVLDEGTEITKTYTESGSKIKVSGNSKPVDFLDKIRNIASFSPALFITAEPKKQLELMLNAINVQFTFDEISEKIGDYYSFSMREKPQYDLNEIGTMRQEIYDDRTGLNRTCTENEHTLNKLIETVPPDAINMDAVKQELANSEQMLASLEEYKNQRIQKVAEKNTQHSLAIADRKAAELKKLAEEKEKEIQQINAKYDKLTTEVSNAFDKEKECVFSEINKERDSVMEGYEINKAPIVQQITELKSKIENSASIIAQQDLIKELSKNLDEVKQKAERASAAIAGLDALKKEKTSHIPISGVNVSNGEIFVDDVPFTRVNTARKIQVALGVARIIAGELKVVCMDGMEALSPENYDAFKEAAKNTDLQFFVTRVGDGPLEISAE
ncbi:MAG: hypothetical protein J0M05_08280 [Candidatus Kapabacteria bacterium]|nr:hypothetical protein [Candidatus Kapabacteria bacterium]